MGVEALLSGRFGERLRLLRGNHSLESVSHRLRAMGIRIDQSTLWKYERGQVASPDPRVLWGIAKLFGTTVDELARLLVGDSPSDPVRLSPTNDELDCLASYRALTREQQGHVRHLMDLLRGATPNGAEFRGQSWDGTDRRHGDRRRAG